MKPGLDVLVPPVTPGDRARARDAGLVPTSRGPVSAAVAVFVWDHRPNRGAAPPEPVPEYMPVPEYPHPDSPRARRKRSALLLQREGVAPEPASLSAPEYPHPDSVRARRKRSVHLLVTLFQAWYDSDL